MEYIQVMSIYVMNSSTNHNSNKISGVNKYMLQNCLINEHIDIKNK